MLYDLRTFGVLYPEVVLVLVLVCTGGAILGTIHLAILERLYASDSQLMYGTYVASHCPMLVLVIRAFLYTLSFNTYSCIPIGIPIFTIPRLSLFLSISIWSVAFLSELIMFIWVKVCLFYILYVPVIFGMLIVLIEVVGYTVRLITLGFRLSANILRGHLIIDCMIRRSMVNVNTFIRILGYIGRVLTLVFELCVIFIQAFVFSLLSCIYLAEAYV